MNNELNHHGILGMKWGVRRFQNKDGSLTPAGKNRQKKYRNEVLDKANKMVSKEESKSIYNPDGSLNRLGEKRASDRYIRLVSMFDNRNIRLADAEDWHRFQSMSDDEVMNEFFEGQEYKLPDGTWTWSSPRRVRQLASEHEKDERDVVASYDKSIHDLLNTPLNKLDDLEKNSALKKRSKSFYKKYTDALKELDG